MARGGTHEGESNITFINLMNGKFRESYKINENTPGAISRIYTNKQGESKTIWEIVDDYLTGYLTDVLFVEGNFGDEVIVKLFDPDDNKTYSIQIQQNSSYATCLLERLPNLDLTQPIKLVPYDFMGRNKKDEEKRFMGVNIFQQESPADLEFSKKIDYFWKDGDLSGGRPKFPENGTKAKIKSYYALLEEFLVDYAKENILMDIPKEPWSGLAVPDKKQVDKVNTPPDNADPFKQEDETDDLPF